MAAPRKTPASRQPRKLAVAGDNAKVHLNLDTFEYERGEREQFAFVLGGRRIVMTDPADVDWQDLAEMDDPFTLAETCMTEEDASYFLEYRMPAKKMQELVKTFQKHYGLGTPGHAPA